MGQGLSSCPLLVAWVGSKEDGLTIFQSVSDPPPLFDATGAAQEEEAYLSCLISEILLYILLGFIICHYGYCLPFILKLILIYVVV